MGVLGSQGPRNCRQRAFCHGWLTDRASWSALSGSLAATLAASTGVFCFSLKDRLEEMRSARSGSLRGKRPALAAGEAASAAAQFSADGRRAAPSSAAISRTSKPGPADPRCEPLVLARSCRGVARKVREPADLVFEVPN